MNKAKIQEALDIIEEELWKTTTEEEISMVVYQVYTTANSFITKEIKRIITFWLKFGRTGSYGYEKS